MKHTLKAYSLPLLLLLAMVLVLQFGCARPPISTTTNTVTKEIIYKDTTVLVKGDTVGVGITSMDSITHLLYKLQREGKPPVITYINKTFKQDDKQLSKLVFRLDSLGRLRVDCIAQEHTINFLTKQIKELKESTVTSEVEKGKIPWWMYVVLGLMTVFILFLVLALNRRR